MERVYHVNVERSDKELEEADTTSMSKKGEPHECNIIWGCQWSKQMDEYVKAPNAQDNNTLQH